MITIGILGCASVARKRVIPALSSMKSITVKAIASRTREKAEQWAAECGATAMSYEGLLQSSVDAIYIPLPIGMHKEWVIKAAQAGKHILCEKSLAENLSSVREMAAACRQYGVVLFENFMCDYHPQHKKVTEMVQNGLIGTPFSFTGLFGFPPLDENNFRYNPLLGGGSLNDAGAYTVFMARKMFGEPLSVTCNLVEDADKKVDIKGTALMEFPAGKYALLAFGFDNVYQNTYSLWGSRGLITVERAYSVPDTIPLTVRLLTNENSRDRMETIEIPPANQFQLIFQNFVDAIHSGKGGYEKLIAQALAMEALRVSARENRKVFLREWS